MSEEIEILPPEEEETEESLLDLVRDNTEGEISLVFKGGRTFVRATAVCDFDRIANGVQKKKG